MDLWLPTLFREKMKTFAVSQAHRPGAVNLQVKTDGSRRNGRSQNEYTSCISRIRMSLRAFLSVPSRSLDALLRKIDIE